MKKKSTFPNKSRVKQMIDEFISDPSPDASIVLSEFNKIQHAFQILKMYAKGSGDLGVNVTSAHEPSKDSLDFDARGLTSEQITHFAKLKHLVTHRDNEISMLSCNSDILVDMIAKLKSFQSQQVSTQPSRMSLVYLL